MRAFELERSTSVGRLPVAGPHDHTPRPTGAGGVSQKMQTKEKQFDARTQEI